MTSTAEPVTTATAVGIGCADAASPSCWGGTLEHFDLRRSDCLRYTADDSQIDVLQQFGVSGSDHRRTAGEGALDAALEAVGAPAGLAVVANRVERALLAGGLSPTSILDTADGTVAFEFEAPSLYLCIECYPSGRAVLLAEQDQTHRRTVRALPQRLGSIRPILRAAIFDVQARS